MVYENLTKKLEQPNSLIFYIQWIQLILHAFALLIFIQSEMLNSSFFNAYLGYYLVLLTVIPLTVGANFNLKADFFVFYEVFILLLIIIVYVASIVFSVLCSLPAYVHPSDIFTATDSINTVQNIVTLKMVICQAVIMCIVIAVYENYVGIGVLERISTSIMLELFPILNREETKPVGLDRTMKDITAILHDWDLDVLINKRYENLKRTRQLHVREAMINNISHSLPSEKPEKTLVKRSSPISVTKKCIIPVDFGSEMAQKYISSDLGEDTRCLSEVLDGTRSNEQVKL